MRLVLYFSDSCRLLSALIITFVIMLRRQFISLCLLLLALFFYSCEEEYVLEGVEFESSLVVNSMFSSGVPWSISVTGSRNILDNNVGFNIVEDAEVGIYDDEGKHLYNLELDESGNYVGEKSPLHGKSYNLKVSATGFKSVYAHEDVPYQGELKVDKYEITDPEGNVETELIFHIGKTDEETYLVWELYKESELGEDGIPEHDRSLVHAWINQLSTHPYAFLKSGKSNVVKTFDGSVVTTLEELENKDDHNKEQLIKNDNEASIKIVGNLDLKIHGGDGENGEGGGDGDDDGEEEIEEDKYELRVMTISKELHDYYQSLDSYFKFNPKSSSIPPNKIHTNIKNGHGIFASYHEQVITF